MPQPPKLTRASLQPIRWTPDKDVKDLGPALEVQLNPETLKVAFGNQSASGDQKGGGSTQHVARATTRLTFDLWFDVSLPQPNGRQVDDVRRLTEKIVKFLTPFPENHNAPPGVRFLWGTFLFEGRMDSVNESLELFSEDGRPLRAGLSISMTQQEVKVRPDDPGAAGAGVSRPNAGAAAPGTTPQELARQGDSVQAMASRAGRPEAWPQIALANGIENPRQLAAGFALNPRASLSGSVPASLGLRLE